MVDSYVSGKGRLTCPLPATRGRIPALGTTFHDSVRVMFLLALKTTKTGQLVTVFLFTVSRAYRQSGVRYIYDTFL